MADSKERVSNEILGIKGLQEKYTAKYVRSGGVMISGLGWAGLFIAGLR